MNLCDILEPSPFELDFPLQRNLLYFSGTILQVIVYVSFVIGHHSADRAQIFQQSASCLNLQLQFVSMHCTIGLISWMT
jgi:hypothetical protein